MYDSDETSGLYKYRSERYVEWRKQNYVFDLLIVKIP